MSERPLTNRGDRMIVHERRRVMTQLLQVSGWLPLANRRILELDSGGEGELTWLFSLGGMPALATRLAFPTQPTGGADEPSQTIDFRADGLTLEHVDATFDLVVLSGVMSGIPDAVGRRALAGEVQRVLKPGGVVLWYDMRYSSPGDATVRPVRRGEVRQLFPGLTETLQSVTLMPAIARRMRGATRTLYPTLAAIPILRSHLVGLIVKPVLNAPTG